MKYICHQNLSNIFLHVEEFNRNNYRKIYAICFVDPFAFVLLEVCTKENDISTEEDK